MSDDYARLSKLALRMNNTWLAFTMVVLPVAFLLGVGVGFKLGQLW